MSNTDRPQQQRDINNYILEEVDDLVWWLESNQGFDLVDIINAMEEYVALADDLNNVC